MMQMKRLLSSQTNSSITQHCTQYSYTTQMYKKSNFISGSESFQSFGECVVHSVRALRVLMYSPGALFQPGAGELNSTQPHLLYLSSCYGRVFTPRHSLIAASREGDQLQQTVTRVSHIMGQKGAHRRRSLIVPRANYSSKKTYTGANGKFPATR